MDLHLHSAHFNFRINSPAYTLPFDTVADCYKIIFIGATSPEPNISFTYYCITLSLYVMVMETGDAVKMMRQK